MMRWRRLLLLPPLLATALAALAFDARPDAGRGAAPVARAAVEVRFAPWDDVEGAILQVIREARREIYVQAFLFTSRALARALVEARGRGVAVAVLADAGQAERAENSQLPLLAAADIPVALETRYAAAHNKVILADPDEADGVVVTGSYNFTYSAQARNAENVVILRGDARVLRAYRDNWWRHRLEAQPRPRTTKATD